MNQIKIERNNELHNKEINNLCNIEYLNNFFEIHKDEETDNIVEHYKHLLLMMLVKKPPLRTSFSLKTKIFEVVYIEQ